MNRVALASEIGRVSRLAGTFQLRSGMSTTEYFDKYRFESDPVLLGAIVDHLVPLIPSSSEVLGGLELGGVPIATALSLRTGLPAVFVRKRPKEYGTRQLAEGRVVVGQRLLIVEDVVTTGGQIVESCQGLRDLGAAIDHALCVIDRESGGRDALAEIGIELHSLFSRMDLEEGPNAV